MAVTLVTDGGPHSADDWAYASACALLEGIPVDQKSSLRTKIDRAKDALRPKIADLFQAHHDSVQAKERALLAAGSHDRLTADLNAGEHTDIEAGIASVVDVMKPLFSEFGSKEIEYERIESAVVDIVRHRFASDLNTNQWIERSWHADRNPTLPQAVAFRKGA